jgi:hypothetical protein
MKNLKLLVVVLVIFSFNLANARNFDFNPNKGGGENPTPAAGCASAVAIATLELNNIRARVEGTGGSFFYDRPNGNAAYNVPRQLTSDDPRFTAIFAGALWMGGLDVNGQLKIAALDYRESGNDFWPGPLNTTTAEIDAATCSKFDEFFGISRIMVDKFTAWYQAGIDDPAAQAADFPGYQVPDEILNWPAHGDVSMGQDWHLAPFFDRDGDDFYDPGQGDYPKYDLVGNIDCRTQRDPRLFGDTTIWFVFNDKGNVHSESQGPSIGMEIRGQAFAFATNDEVNDMTFYNYEMINRSTFTLTETYFGQWVDADLGNSDDDYVGCDAERGLGYCYNGDADDENVSGIDGYGTTPPVIGVDFFEGPFADNDGIDNPLTQNVQLAIDSGGIPYPGLGIGYGDGIIDNERYGMRKFIYYNRGGQFAGDGDPSSALDHYNYLRGIWRDGAGMVWGVNGHPATAGATNVLADLLFPGDSDPLNWSTRGNTGVTPVPWSEFNAAAGGTPNTPFDRRFLESAGPFTLEPGAVNDLTVGIVYARATSGDNLQSIVNLQVADDKAQSLFDNCFKITEGPDAPAITFQELDKELILYLTNGKTSNNFNEAYSLKDPFIAIPDTMDGVYQGSDADKDTLKVYKFQGYQVYQVKNALVTVSELGDPAKSRLAAQVDIKDGIESLVNTLYNAEFNANVPFLMVQAADAGIKHSFRFTKDLFATGNNRLVNHKTYYYMAIAYGHNEYKEYDPNDPFKLDGQRKPYIGSRKSGTGQGITSFSAIPHNPAPENGGTIAHSQYGDMPMITRIEGQGNGGNDLDMTAGSEAVAATNNFVDFIQYKSGKGPITVKVVDPLAVRGGKYRVQFRDTNTATVGDLSDAFWILHLPIETLKPGEIDSIRSDQTILVENEQLFLGHGISIAMKQTANAGAQSDIGNGVISASIEFENPAAPWLTGFRDIDGQTDANWIRSGVSVFDVGGVVDPFNDHILAATDVSNPIGFVDHEQDFEGMLAGTWAPYRMVSFMTDPAQQTDVLGYPFSAGKAVKESRLKFLPSVDIVFTSDKSKWSRSLVFEAQVNPLLAEGAAAQMELRETPSVDKNGNPDGELYYDGTPVKGKGWFPGYAIDVSTGERLNIAFAEDSWLAGDNGRDMKWNPSSSTFAGVNQELRMGGKHYVYVFRKGYVNSLVDTMPTYDGCDTLYKYMKEPSVGISSLRKMFTMSSCVWAGIPMLAPGQSLLSNTAKVKLRVGNSFNALTTASTVNGGLPMYDFDMSGMQVETGNASAMDSALAMINVVPNPYYAFSEYETDALDNRVKITNLPELCTISIYNVNGTLMRRFAKDNPKTSLDWDLKNHAKIPVAGGVYLIHVEVPNVGERTLKWFGVIKPTDLNGF